MAKQEQETLKTPGAQGPQGVQGPIGPAGAQGEEGDAGPVGPQGPTGATGATGPQGSQGPQGSTGIAGPQGPAGPQGVQGPTGSQGPIGADGPEGPEGPAGPTGAAGVAGATGSVGATGPAGPQGVPGPTGADGPQGVQGPTGPAGATGAQGVPGPTGSTGAAGAAGASLLSGSGVPGAGLGNDGDRYVDTATGNLYLKTAGAWAIVANVWGPTQLYGTGVPGSGVGQNGDTYEDTVLGKTYLKTGGTWALTGYNAWGPSIYYTPSGALPTVADVPEGSVVFYGTTGAIYKKVSGAWVLQSYAIGISGVGYAVNSTGISFPPERFADTSVVNAPAGTNVAIPGTTTTARVAGNVGRYLVVGTVHALCGAALANNDLLEIMLQKETSGTWNDYRAIARVTPIATNFNYSMYQGAEMYVDLASGDRLRLLLKAIGSTAYQSKDLALLTITRLGPIGYGGATLLA